MPCWCVAPHGWRPFLVSPDGTPQNVTFFSGETQSCLDDFLISPDCTFLSEVAVATRVPTMQHCVLSLIGDLSCSEYAHPVCHPPQIDSGAGRSIVTPIDWDQASHRCKSAYQELQATLQIDPWTSATDLVTRAWDEFLECFRRHLRACHVDNPRDPTLAYGADWRTKKIRSTKKGLSDPHAVVRRAVWRLVALVRGECHTNVRDKIRRQRHEVCKILSLTSLQFEQALMDPHSHSRQWVQKLQHVGEQEKRRQRHIWKKKLACPNGHPTRAVYR